MENTRIQPTVQPYVIDRDYEDIYTKFEKHIKPSIIERTFSTVYNFQPSGFTTQAISERMVEVFNAQSNAFKISISLGYILKDSETGEFCYFWASQNNQLLFETPRLVRNESDVTHLCDAISQKDLQAHVTYPSTKYTFVKCTNVAFYVTRLSGVLIGGPIVLPDFLKNNKGLHSLTTSNKTGRPYTDQLCFFRCLALHRGAAVSALEAPTKELLNQFCNSIGMDVKDFDGVTLDQLEDLSSTFDVGLNVYEQRQEKGKRVTDLIYRSVKQDNLMYLNLYGNHFSYIKDLDKYSSTYLCPRCKQIFPRHSNFNRHMKTCDSATREIYVNGTYRPSPTIFDQLEEVDIIVPQEDRFFPYRICYDIECYLDPDFDQTNSSKVSYSHQHILASVSICSNVPGYGEPKCFISTGNQRELVQTMVQYMKEISHHSKSLLEDKFDDILDQIEALEHDTLDEKFQAWLSQTPVISFNGSK